MVKRQSVERTHDIQAASTRGKLSVSRLWPVAIIVAGACIFSSLGWDRYLTFDSLRENRETLLHWTSDNRFLAITLFITGYVVVVAFSLPGATWMTLGGGFLFGTALSIAVVVFAATLGAVAIFLIARYALADYFRAKMGSAGDRIEAGFRENALSYLLFLRLIPVFPFWLVNLVPAFVGVSLRTYAIGTFVGIIPGSAVFCSVGNGLGVVFDAGGTPDLGIIFQPKILGPIFALAIMSLLPVIYKRIRS